MRRHSMLLVYATMLASAACAPATTNRNDNGTTRAADRIVAEAPGIIRATLDSTAAGWNRGDLAAYLAPYASDATEMLATGPAGGVDAIEKTMREGFWKTGRPVQQLHYESVVVRMLGTDGAVVTGKFVLTGADRPERTGWFTTVWLRTPQGWRMIHDAS